MSVKLRVGSEEVLRRATSSSGGAPAVRKRRYRDSGDSVWKNSRMAPISAHVAGRTIAVEPSRRTSRLAIRSSVAGSEGDTTCMFDGTVRKKARAVPECMPDYRRHIEWRFT